MITLTEIKDHFNRYEYSNQFKKNGDNLITFIRKTYAKDHPRFKDWIDSNYIEPFEIVITEIDEDFTDVQQVVGRDEYLWTFPEPISSHVGSLIVNESIQAPEIITVT